MRADRAMRPQLRLDVGESGDFGLKLRASKTALAMGNSPWPSHYIMREVCQV